MMTQFPRLALTIVLPTLVLGCAPKVVIEDDVPPLDLEVISTFTIPDSFSVSRVDAGSDGTVALISDRWSHILVGRGGEFAEFGAGILKRPVAISLDSLGRVSKVVDAGTRSILTFQNERLTAETQIDSPGTIKAAISSAKSVWRIAGVDSTGADYIMTIRGDNNGSVHTLGGVSPHSEQATTLALISSGEVVLVKIGRPQQWAMITPDDRLVLTQVFDSTSFLIDRDTADSLDPFWVAQGIVPIDDYILYSLTDLRSDERILLLLDSAGRLVRQTNIEAPIGFVGSVPGRPIIIAVRNINGQEIIKYRWRWRGETGQ